MLSTSPKGPEGTETAGVAREEARKGRYRERGEEGTQLARAQVKTCSLFVRTEALKHILIVLTLRQRKCCILQGQRIVCITVGASQWVGGLCVRDLSECEQVCVSV